MSCWTLTTCHRLAFDGLWSRPLLWSCRVIKNHQKARQCTVDYCRLGHTAEKRIEKARVLAKAERVSQVTVDEPPPYIIGVRKWHSNTEWFKMIIMPGALLPNVGLTQTLSAHLKFPMSKVIFYFDSVKVFFFFSSWNFWSKFEFFKPVLKSCIQVQRI